MLCRVALEGTDVSEELSASLIRVTRIGELGTTLVVTSNQRTRAIRRNIPEDAILHSHRRENLKSYKGFTKYNQDILDIGTWRVVDWTAKNRLNL
jgi:hypothetical protein